MMNIIKNNSQIEAIYIRRHLIYPSVLVTIFFVNAFTPVYVLGCLTRGLTALTIALISGLASLLAAIMGLKGRVRHDINTGWWVASSIILLIPVVALIFLA